MTRWQEARCEVRRALACGLNLTDGERGEDEHCCTDFDVVEHQCLLKMQEAPRPSGGGAQRLPGGR